MSGYVTAMRALVGSRPLLLVSAGVVVLDSQRRLLLQRRSDDDTWALPGGALEPGEALLETAQRELHEETGLEAHDLALLHVFSGPEFFLRYPNGDEAYVVGAVFLAQRWEGELRTDSEETRALAYFDPDHLPDEVNEFNRHLLRRCVPLLPDVLAGVPPLPHSANEPSPKSPSTPRKGNQSTSPDRSTSDSAT